MKILTKTLLCLPETVQEIFVRKKDKEDKIKDVRSNMHDSDLVFVMLYLAFPFNAKRP